MINFKGPKTVFGVLLNKHKEVRDYAYKSAADDLWRRNGIKNRKGYKLEEGIGSISMGGVSAKEFRLYKLIDASVVTISAKVDYEVETGIDRLIENRGIRGE